jgi:hypothetical protein
MFPDKEWKICRPQMVEKRQQNLFDAVQRRFRGALRVVPATDPIRFRSKLLEPGVRRGQNQMAAGSEQRRKRAKQFHWRFDAINQVGSQHKVELADIVSQIGRIANFE